MNLSSQHRCHEALRHAGYGELCAWTLARAHARSGDGVAIAAYLGGLR
jgi:Uncharacterized protein conserved in bacteria (DUF2252)